MVGRKKGIFEHNINPWLPFAQFLSMQNEQNLAVKLKRFFYSTLLYQPNFIPICLYEKTLVAWNKPNLLLTIQMFNMPSLQIIQLKTD
jgi:hypothetical protein